MKKRQLVLSEKLFLKRHLYLMKLDNDANLRQGNILCLVLPDNLTMEIWHTKQNRMLVAVSIMFSLEKVGVPFLGFLLQVIN